MKRGTLGIISLLQPNGCTTNQFIAIMINKRAECVIRWKDTDESESVIFSLDGTDNDGIFFVCHSEDEFMSLTEDTTGEDFDILEFKLL